MESTLRNEYIKSDDYKVVCLLATYRKICNLTGVELFEIFTKHREKSLYKCFLTVVEAGFEKLDDIEIIEYTRYIANAMGYDAQKFYTELYDEARKFAFSPSQVYDNQTIVHAISNITHRMNE